MSALLDPAAELPAAAVRDIVRRALAEDLPWGDITSAAVAPIDARARGRFILKEDGVVCGLPVAAAVFAEMDPAIDFRPCLAEGSHVHRGAVIAEVEGNARSLLGGERTALNLLQRMGGIATATAHYVEAIRGTRATIVDTRKTAPGLRLLDKYAVRTGGGSNHRFSLSDGVLVKDNHLAITADNASLTERIRAIRGRVPHTVKIEVEVDRVDQIAPVLEGGADIILLDNMPPAVLREAVALIDGRALTEASGGITLDSVRVIAESGVDLISVGALTHSVRALDISFDFLPDGG
jgi:nicotinate-nucleotide pyrophosphorylase (carboxylating)